MIHSHVYKLYVSLRIFMFLIIFILVQGFISQPNEELYELKYQIKKSQKLHNQQNKILHALIEISIEQQKIIEKLEELNEKQRQKLYNSTVLHFMATYE